MLGIMLQQNRSITSLCSSTTFATFDTDNLDSPNRLRFIKYNDNVSSLRLNNPNGISHTSSCHTEVKSHIHTSLPVNCIRRLSETTALTSSRQTSSLSVCAYHPFRAQVITTLRSLYDIFHQTNACGRIAMHARANR